VLEATTQWHPRPPRHTPPTGSPAPVCADVTGPPPILINQRSYRRSQVRHT
jgi:hypothetical protein